jgi:hypothetical protein
MSRTDKPEEVKQWFQDTIHGLWPIAMGSLSLRKSPCIREHCRACESGEGHSSYALYGRKGKRRFSIYVPDELSFPDLYRQFLEARRVWAARQREGIRVNVEAVAAEMTDASVPDICRTAGIGLQFLMKRFPDLYRQIVSRYLDRCDNIRKQKRETLRQDVHRAVAELSARGLRPTFTRVAPLLSDQAAKDWKLIQLEIDRSMRELSCELEP